MSKNCSKMEYIAVDLTKASCSTELEVGNKFHYFLLNSKTKYKNTLIPSSVNARDVTLSLETKIFEIGELFVLTYISVISNVLTIISKENIRVTSKIMISTIQ